MPDICIYVLPDLLPASGLRGGIAVIIDVLRASTTIVHALAHGAERVIPCASLDEAHYFDNELKCVQSGSSRQVKGSQPGAQPDSLSRPDSTFCREERPAGADQDSQSGSSRQVKGSQPDSLSTPDSTFCREERPAGADQDSQSGSSRQVKGSQPDSLSTPDSTFCREERPAGADQDSQSGSSRQVKGSQPDSLSTPDSTFCREERPAGADQDSQSGSSRQVKGSQPLLGGERHGELIPGFDLDNSPLSYTAARVGGRTIIFTTTNGTRALRASESADRVLIGAFVNLSAVVDELRHDGRPVHLVCAGTDGKMSAEDILFAGMVAQRLLAGTTEGSFRLADMPTRLAVQFAEIKNRTPESFRETIRQSRGGANLVALGFDRDIERASQLDLFSIVPEWSATERDLRIR